MQMRPRPLSKFVTAACLLKHDWPMQKHTHKEARKTRHPAIHPILPRSPASENQSNTSCVPKAFCTADTKTGCRTKRAAQGYSKCLRSKCLVRFTKF